MDTLSAFYHDFEHNNLINVLSNYIIKKYANPNYTFIDNIDFTFAKHDKPLLYDMLQIYMPTCQFVATISIIAGAFASYSVIDVIQFKTTIYNNNKQSALKYYAILCLYAVGSYLYLKYNGAIIVLGFCGCIFALLIKCICHVLYLSFNAIYILLTPPCIAYNTTDTKKKE